MRKVTEIYNEYNIMPELAKHQIRVASVAKMICDRFVLPIDTQGVLRTCLFHDMGNIIKSDFGYFPDFLEPKGLEYWQGIKNEFIKKYGDNEHYATEKIVQEIGLSEKELNYLSTVGFSKILRVVQDESWEKKICCYSDQRVGPRGVLSIDERLREGQKRYAGRKEKTMPFGHFEELTLGLKKLENQIFSKTDLRPADINDQSISDIFLDLSAFEVV